MQRDLIISMNESDVLRFKVDTFCFRQNHFNPVKFRIFFTKNQPETRQKLFSYFQGEIESVRIGFLMLWRNKTLAKHFCGQIGDFINANGDENVLRISLPILTSRFYCTFLFRTKPKADEFLEMAKAFKDIGGRGIKAMSIDELQNRPKLVSIFFTNIFFVISPTMDFSSLSVSLQQKKLCIQAVCIIGWIDYGETSQQSCFG